MNKILKIQEQILNLIYPQTCGICGKLAPNSLCKKCEIKIKKESDMNIIQTGEEIEDKYFNELMYIFKYEGQIRKLILDYKFNEKSYIYFLRYGFSDSNILKFFTTLSYIISHDIKSLI